jgi:opacity protein-like surface antigen
MKKIVLTSLLGLFVAGAASAAMTPYASLKLGYANIDTVDVKYKDHKVAEFSEMDGYTGTIAGGAKFDISNMFNMRGELEYTYLDTEQDEGNNPMKLFYNTVMANAYADFGDASWVVNPYVGLGLGYTFGQLSDTNYKEHVAGMSYAVSAGITYPVSTNVVLDLGAKYTMQDLAWDEHTDLEYETPVLSFLFGARYMF